MSGKRLPRTIADRRDKHSAKPTSTDMPVRRGGERRNERNLNSFLVNTLGGEIIGGHYPQGSLLPGAAEMCERFVVSRTALREAYSVLTAKGLIYSRPNVGTRVRSKSNWNMLDPEILAWHLQSLPAENFVADLYTLRQIIEPSAAAFAAAKPTPQAIERIGSALADMERFQDGAGDLLAADLHFHLAILDATGNPFMSALGHLIRVALLGMFKISWEGASRIRIQADRLRQHKEVFEAIRDGQPELARERMTCLLRDSYDDGLKSLGRRNSVVPKAEK